MNKKPSHQNPEEDIDIVDILDNTAASKSETDETFEIKYADDGNKPDKKPPKDVSNILVALSEAISAHRVVSFTYHDKQRRVLPYAVGKTKHDNMALLAYFVSGYSESLSKSGWRLYLLEEMDQVIVELEGFDPDENCGAYTNILHDIVAQI